jgi:hypothetical protein
MSAIATFPGLGGFYVLSPDGQLGFYDQNNKFVLDAKLNKTFADYNRQYLMTYLRNPEQGNFRLAIIHQTQEERPWGCCSLLLEKHIVRRLYPVTGMTTEVDLTTFQKKNREKSIYRGMELFLEYKDTSAPDMPVFCPVLFDREKTLNDYASILNNPVTAAERDTPVVEVINLLAGIPIAKRSSPEVAILKEKIYQGIVKKGMRKSEEFTLIEDIRRSAQADKKERVSGDPYGDIDKRAERQVTLDSKGHDGKSAVGIHDSAFIQNISSSLVGHPEPADSMTLKNFFKFRDLEHDKLEALAARCLVYKAPPGTQLLERGTKDTWNLYLLEGVVKLIAADGVEKMIEGGTDTARNPVSFLKPRMYTAVAFTRVSFLWIDDKLVETVMRSQAAPVRRDGTA